jgi:uncharacterized membrane protein
VTAWFTRIREAANARLWPIPVLAVVAAVLLGLGLSALDAVVDDQLSGTAGDWLFGGDASAARSLLSAIASSLITVTALTFSLTVVSLQLASTQFSPRLLRTFTSDQFVQVTLALFLATFTYALTILRAVRSSGDAEQSEFVPRLAVTVAFVLTVASVIGLVLFLAHLTQELRVESMLRNVHREGVRTLRAALAEREDDPPVPAGPVPGSPSDAPGADALTLLADGDGFVTWIDRARLLEIAVEHDTLIEITAYPGSFVCRGTPWGWVRSGSAHRPDPEREDQLRNQVAECLHLHFERTAAQDLGFALRQLTDVANKALSPGINDLTTAIHALGYISALLCDLAENHLGSEVLRDGEARTRVVLRQPDVAAYVDLGLSQPRRLGATHPEVLAMVFRVLLDLAHRAAPQHRGVIREELRRLRSTVAAQDFDPQERASLQTLGHMVESTLGTTPSPEHR